MNDEQLIIPLEELGRGNIGQVGGKNASLGEMIRHLGGQGGAGAGGLCHDRPRLSVLPRGKRAGASDPQSD